jgi:2-succinyl-6-hydroxy-2,4-cyclohexadiene-1-carboxylate synthase
VLAHGFTQTGRCWGSLGNLLRTNHELRAVDLPGHGGSSDVRADLVEAGNLLAEAGGSGTFDLLGYSLGARIALHAALSRPERIGRLVLIGGTPGIVDAPARQVRRQRDDELAEELERSGDVDAFIDRWLTNPMFARLPHDPAAVAERKRNTAPGLASSLRLAGTGTQAPLWERLSTLELPTLLVVGTTDVRFTAIAEAMVHAAPNAVLALVAGAGHAAHAEQPALTSRIIGSWLAQTPH